jgi:hypothetical protein
VGLLRFSMIGSDPPHWIEVAYLVDGGWWSAGAKGEVLFGNPYRIDYGMSYLVTPAYNKLLELVYSVIGVGIAQTQLLSSIFNFLSILVLSLSLWRCAGFLESVIIAVLLGLSPFFWAHGRLPLPESAQTFFIVGSFALIVTAAHSRTAAFLSGLSIVTAVAIKPTALPVGLFPMAISCALVYFYERHYAGTQGSAPANFISLSALFFISFGILSGSLFILFVHVLPNWEYFLMNFSSESANAYPFGWKQILTLPGRSLVSREVADAGGFIPIFWRVAKWSPAILLGFWLYSIFLVSEIRQGFSSWIRSLNTLEIFTISWILAGLFGIFVLIGQDDYRYVALIPILAVPATLFISRSLNQLSTWNQKNFNPVQHVGYIYSFVLWALLLLPLMLALKPMAARGFMSIFRDVQIGNQPGIEYEAAGTLFMAAWFMMLLIISTLRKSGLQVSLFIQGRAKHAILALFIMLLAVEMGSLGHYFANAEATLVNQQSRLQNYLREDEVVVGRMGGTLLMPLKVVPLRRASAKHRPMEIGDELTYVDLYANSKFLIVARKFNFTPWIPYGTVRNRLMEKGYESAHSFEVGPSHKGIKRFEFELFRKK